MKGDRKHENNLYAKLQQDVDAILEGVEHLFDDMADYSTDVEEIHHIDIDYVLSDKFEFTPHVHAKRSRMSKMKWNNTPIRPNNAPIRRNIPTNKIIKAMPKPYQEEARVKVFNEPKKQDGKFHIFFRRLEF